MICPRCYGKTSVTQTRVNIDFKQIRRTRVCKDCGKMFHTFEFAEKDVTHDILVNFKEWNRRVVL